MTFLEIDSREYLKETQKNLELLLRSEISSVCELSNERLKALDVLVQERLKAIDEATKVYVTATAEKIVRQETDRQASTFWTRELQKAAELSINLQLTKITERLEILEKTRYIQQGMASQKSVTIAQIVSGISVAIALISLLSRVL